MPYRPTGRPPGRPRYPEPLTPAELRVLDRLRKGETNAVIASHLEISPDAVKFHVSNMLGKLELENREQLAVWREAAAARLAWLGVAAAWKWAALGAGVLAAGVMAFLVLRPAEDGSSSASGDLITGVISRGMNGEPANAPSRYPSISGDGRLVAFESDASNLVPNDTNGVSDIFVFDRQTGGTRRASLAPGGKEANGPSHRPSLSADGKWVAFDSEASNLIPNDRNGDRTKAVGLVSASVAALFDPAVRGGGPGLQSTLDAIAGSDVFIVDLQGGATELVSITSAGAQGNLGSFGPSLSEDGRYVAFESVAPNFRGAPARDGVSAGWNGLMAEDVFIRDRRSATTELISRFPDGALATFGSGFARISTDGSAVAFLTRDPQLGNAALYAACVWERSSNRVRSLPLPDVPPQTEPPLYVGGMSRPSISANGAVVTAGLYASAAVRPQPEGVKVAGVFVWGGGSGKPGLIAGSESSPEIYGPAGPSLSNDGGLLLYRAPSSLVLYELSSSSARDVRVPRGTSVPVIAAISGDGRWVVGQVQVPNRTNQPIDFDVVVLPT